jgi:hypothetical protein
VVDYLGRINPLIIGGSKKGGQVPITKADATMDEVYLWDRHMEDTTELPNAGVSVREVVSNVLWGKGRYYKEGGEFTSGSIDLGKLRPAIRPIGGGSSEPYPDGVSKVTLGADLSYLGEYCPLILGVSWTAYDEDIYDYRGTPSDPDRPIRMDPEIDLFLSLDDGASWNTLPMKKGWCWVYKHVELPSLLRYKVKIEIDAGLNSILLESPIFDDISIYYKTGGPRFLSWMLV